MARYDRIARLDCPQRSHAFPAWLALRDLAGRERDPELNRRTRLRFLVLRPVHRLLAHGFGSVGKRSMDQQLACVRAELARLAHADRERRALARCLDTMASLSYEELPADLIAAGAMIEAAGHTYGAEEYYLTALEVSRRLGLASARLMAARSLGRVYGARREWTAARERLEAAVADAEAQGDPDTLEETLRELVMVLIEAGDLEAADGAVAMIGQGDEPAADGNVDGVRAAALCAIALASGQVERALESGWRAIEHLRPGTPSHSRVLLDLATGFRRHGLREAAEACYLMVTRAHPDLGLTSEARIQHALVAAEAGDRPAFQLRREELASAQREMDRHRAAAMHIALSRGAMLVGDLDGARAHLHQASEMAREEGLEDTAADVETLAPTLEERPKAEIPANNPQPSDAVRSIAARIESLSQDLVPSG